MGTAKSKQRQVAIDDKIDNNEALEKPGPFLNQTSVSSNQQSVSSGSSSNKILTGRTLIQHTGSIHSQNSRGMEYVESKDDDKDKSSKNVSVGNNASRLLDLTLNIPSSPMNSARIDINTKIITIPASSLDCSSMHGKGLLLSPMNSARKDSSVRIIPSSPGNSFRAPPSSSGRIPPISPGNSFRAPPLGSSSSPAQTPPASSRRNSMENNVLPTIHSALNFAELLNGADDEYSVAFYDTSQGHSRVITAQ